MANTLVTNIFTTSKGVFYLPCVISDSNAPAINNRFTANARDLATISVFAKRDGNEMQTPLNIDETITAWGYEIKRTGAFTFNAKFPNSNYNQNFNLSYDGVVLYAKAIIFADNKAAVFPVMGSINYYGSTGSITWDYSDIYPKAIINKYDVSFANETYYDYYAAAGNNLLNSYAPTDPYADAGDSTTGGGGGTFDGSSDPVPVPSLPSVG